MSDTTTTDAGALLALLGDEYVQQILVATDEEPLSARDLSERLDAARSTVYDRTERMAEHDLLVERTRIVDDGSHHAVYVANVDHLDVDVVDGELVASVETSESAAERFTTIWNDIRGV